MTVFGIGASCYVPVCCYFIAEQLMIATQGEDLLKMSLLARTRPYTALLAGRTLVNDDAPIPYMLIIILQYHLIWNTSTCVNRMLIFIVDGTVSNCAASHISSR